MARSLYRMNSSMFLTHVFVERPNGSTFSRKPREHTTADKNYPHARIGGCCVLASPQFQQLYHLGHDWLDRIVRKGPGKRPPWNISPATMSKEFLLPMGHTVSKSG